MTLSGTKPWYTSITMWAAVLSIILGAVLTFVDAVSVWAKHGFDLGQFSADVAPAILGAIAAWGRVRATTAIGVVGAMLVAVALLLAPSSSYAAESEKKVPLLS